MLRCLTQTDVRYFASTRSRSNRPSIPTLPVLPLLSLLLSSSLSLLNEHHRDPPTPSTHRPIAPSRIQQPTPTLACSRSPSRPPLAPPPRILYSPLSRPVPRFLGSVIGTVLPSDGFDVLHRFDQKFNFPTTFIRPSLDVPNVFQSFLFYRKYYLCNLSQTINPLYDSFGRSRSDANEQGSTKPIVLDVNPEPLGTYV